MHRYWQSASRYYSAEITQDLFGTWLLVRRWGGRFNARGQAKTMLVDSFNAGVQLMEEIARMRKKRGYEELKA